jgi:hypothetical protein
MANDYHFHTTWHFKASEDEIRAILADATDLPRWWRAVYLSAERITAGDENHIGETIRLHTKGYLPYTLKWDFTVIQSKPLTIEAKGDFIGRGVWTFEPHGEMTTVTYDWRIRAEKPLLKRLTFLLRPIFSWNHHWAMEMGRHSLELELARRRAKTDAERATIPQPPSATPSNLLAWVVHVLGRKK